MTRTRFDAPWIVAHQDGGHRTLRDGCVVVEDDRIVHVGHDYAGPVDETVRTDAVITPGLISMHAHLHESPVDKSLGEDVPRRQWWSTSLIDILPTKGASLREQDMLACTELSLHEHIRTGTTTVLQLGQLSEQVAERIAASGLRGYVGEFYRSGRWFTPDGRRVAYEWDEPAGHRGLDRAVRLVEDLRGYAGDRIRGLLTPAQVDTCTEELLRASRAAADDLDVPLTLHAAQSLSEFHEVTRRYGRTPVEWLDSIGFLGERVVLGHGLFVTGNPWVNFAGDDLGLLADSGTTVAYSAWVMARNGIAMESYARYLERGVNVCLGTDTTTQSMIESCRWAAIVGKLVSRRADGVTAGQVFDAATLHAARALGRDDLGRIAPGAKADLLFWRTGTLHTTPMRDPVRVLVYYAQAEDLADVMVDGAWVQRDGVPLHTDLAAAVEGVDRAAEAVWAGWSEHDWAGRDVVEHLPMTYPEFREQP